MKAWNRLPRDKADTLLLLLSSVLVLAPHAAHLPWWITASVTVTLLWRAFVTLRGSRLPPRWLLLPVTLMAMAGIYASFGTWLGREAGVAMLVLLLAFKLLEMHARRDLFLVIFLGFFLVMTNFFYSQSIATGLTMIATIILLLTAQLSFQYTGTAPSLARRLRLAATMFVIAAPLGLLLFVAFPRIQGPLWGLPSDAHSARSGLSDSMAPGTFSSLALSEENAFRVRFFDPAPAQNKLYWRTIVLGNYDGRTWTRVNRRHAKPEPVTLQLGGTPVRYQVTMEASGQRWLPTLEMPERLPRIDGNAVTASTELEIFTSMEVRARVRYDATSYPTNKVQADASADHLQQWLTLPAGFNPRTLAWAKLLQRAQALASIDAVLTAFREDQFRYTLQPPLLGRDAMDDFLFSSKAGFCEHYASAFVVLMRAMKIPARVVTGYQGGEFNPVDGYLTVRQSDAHAWAEVWLTGRGWLRIDPTAAVAPERIDLAWALPRPAPFGLQVLADLMNFQHDRNSLLAQWGFTLNAINNAWNQWVLDYNPERQRGVMQGIDAALHGWRAVLGAAIIAVLIGLARWLRARLAPDPADALYRAFCRHQARRGMARAPDEGPRAYADRLDALDAAPAQKAAMKRFLHLYSALKYGPARPAETATEVKTLKSLLTQSR